MDEKMYRRFKELASWINDWLPAKEEDAAEHHLDADELYSLEHQLVEVRHDAAVLIESLERSNYGV
jgi:hypothetical protein